jgi:hypothetical protein
MRLKLKLTGAIVLGLAAALIGMPVANAQTHPVATAQPHPVVSARGHTATGASTYILEEVDPLTNNILCVDDAAHNAIVFTTNYLACAGITFTDPISYGGNTWWELKLDNGLCLNWATSGYVYADSCNGDYNEHWYNHVRGELINLEGNLVTRHNTFLQPYVCTLLSNGDNYCSVAAVNSSYAGWIEV